jgi:hypothetical protein
MEIERLGKEPCWHRQQTGMDLDLVGVAGHCVLADGKPAREQAAEARTHSAKASELRALSLFECVSTGTLSDDSLQRKMVRCIGATSGTRTAPPDGGRDSRAPWQG